LAIEFPDADDLNRDLADLFDTRPEFRAGFDMHPAALNLLRLADECPCVAQVREMFLDGLRRWLRAEQARGEWMVDVTVFSNLAQTGDFTLVHNHGAEVVGVYYVRTAATYRPAVVLPAPDGDYDYFAAEDGALVLHDPRFNANLAAVRSADYAKVFPRPGLMVLFPGYLWHSVTPHRGDGRRLSLSANFVLRPSGGTNAEPWSVVIE
jgi:hypothetical protein